MSVALQCEPKHNCSRDGTKYRSNRKLLMWPMLTELRPEQIARHLVMVDPEDFVPAGNLFPMILQAVGAWL